MPQIRLPGPSKSHHSGQVAPSCGPSYALGGPPPDRLVAPKSTPTRGPAPILTVRIPCAHRPATTPRLYRSHAPAHRPDPGAAVRAEGPPCTTTLLHHPHVATKPTPPAPQGSIHPARPCLTSRLRHKKKSRAWPRGVSCKRQDVTPRLAALRPLDHKRIQSQ